MSNSGPDTTTIVAWTALAFMIVLVVVIVIAFAIIATELTQTNNNVTTLSNTVNGVDSISSQATICTGSLQTPIYSFLVTAGNFVVQSSLTSIVGTTIQNAGAPTVTLCSTGGTGKVAVFSYVSNIGDPATNSFGTSSDPPTGFNLGNNGSAIGYAFTGQFVQGLTLNPIYLAAAQFNGGTSTDTIMTYQNSPVYGAITYTRVGSTPLGFGL